MFQTVCVSLHAHIYSWQLALEIQQQQQQNDALTGNSKHIKCVLIFAT